MKRALVLGLVLAVAPSPPPARAGCAHGQILRVSLHKCVERSSSLARLVHLNYRHHPLPPARATVDHEVTTPTPEARPVAAIPAAQPQAAAGLTPRGRESQPAVVSGESTLPFELKPSRLNYQTHIEWRLK